MVFKINSNIFSPKKLKNSGYIPVVPFGEMTTKKTTKQQQQQQKI